MTVREAYESAIALLMQSGFDTDEARLTARVFLDRATGTAYSHLASPNELFGGAFSETFSDEIERAASGEPLAYICNRREFFGLTFLCDERALIPRSDTETLVEAAVAPLRDKNSVLIADMGTGTGCIAISIAHALAQSMVYATDISAPALELARTNAKRNGVENRITFLRGAESRWAEPLMKEDLGGQLDCVLSNPPYIARDEIETLQPQIRDWEPRLALDGGIDGLDCYREIAAQCAQLLQPNGFLAVELGAGQFAAVRRIFEECSWGIEPPVPDLSGIERVLIARPQS